MMKLDFVKFNVIHNGTFHFIIDCSIYIIGFYMFIAVVCGITRDFILKKDFTEKTKILYMYILDAYITLMLLLAIRTNSIYTCAIIDVFLVIPVSLYGIMFTDLDSAKFMIYKFSFWILLMILALIDKGVMVI